MAAGSTSSTYSRDKAQAVGWLINAITAIALAVGAWFFSSLTDTQTLLGAEIKGLSKGIAALNTQVAVMGEQRERINELRDDLRSHSEELGHPHGVAARVDTLRADHIALDKRLRQHEATQGHPATVEQVAALRAVIEQVQRTRFTERDGLALGRLVDKLADRVTELERRMGSGGGG